MQQVRLVNNNFTPTPRFFAHLVAVIARLQRESA